MTAAPATGAADRASANTGAGDAGSTYCDTGLIVAAVLGPADPFYVDAMRFFRDAELGGVRLVISSLALSEAADVILKRTKAAHRCTDEGGREREAVDARAAAAVKELINFVNELKASKRAEILGGSDKLRPNFTRLYEKMLKHRGRTPQARKGDTYRHEGIGAIDWIHIELAYLAGARAICTTDKAMAQIAGDGRYGRMEIVVLRPR